MVNGNRGKGKVKSNLKRGWVFDEEEKPKDVDRETNQQQPVSDGRQIGGDQRRTMTGTVRVREILENKYPGLKL